MLRFSPLYEGMYIMTRLFICPFIWNHKQELSGFCSPSAFSRLRIFTGLVCFCASFCSGAIETARTMEEEWPSTSWGWSAGTPSMMIEQAKEELQILEAQHPNRFDYLKLELKSFISFLESQNMPLSVHNNGPHCVNPTCMPTLSSATTQASSTTKKRKKGSSDVQRVKEVNVETSKNKVQRVDSDGHIRKRRRRRRRIDVVIERAQACLRKIQLFKTSFC